MKKAILILGLGLFIVYNQFDLNRLTVIFWIIALCIGYGLLLANMRIWLANKKWRIFHN